jgi:hypothetical protein
MQTMYPDLSLQFARQHVASLLEEAEADRLARRLRRHHRLSHRVRQSVRTSR